MRGPLGRWIGSYAAGHAHKDVVMTHPSWAPAARVAAC